MTGAQILLAEALSLVLPFDPHGKASLSLSRYIKALSLFFEVNINIKLWLRASV